MTEPTCANCNASCTKPLRCSICKSISYCSAACQKEDWRFHKRNCKEPPKSAEPSPLDRLAMGREAKEEANDKDDKLKSLVDSLVSGQQPPGTDPKIAEQVKSMMSNLGLGDSAEKSPAEEEAAPARDTCKNCMQVCEKPQRCGVCKAATYCSAKCQREDWQYHKRICKKPTEPELSKSKKDEAAPVASQAPPVDRTASEPLRPKAADKEVVTNEDVGSWYKHREWKPGEEKKDFQPERVDQEVGSQAPQTASKWNAAGTWEEKSMLPWWTEALQRLKSLKADSFAGVITVERLGDVTGEAQICHIRGIPRFFFDLRFDLGLSIQFPTSSRAYKSEVALVEFSNDVAAAQDEFPVKVTAQSDSDRRAVETIFVPKLQAALRSCIAEYETQVAAPEGGAFPGQLPPAQS